MIRALVILGPTGCGKSALALLLAKVREVEIISMDSAQVFCGLDIGSAKPDAAVRSRVAHHLLDVCSPDESFSAAKFCTECNRLVPEISGRGALPVICGGSMMYYHALVAGSRGAA